MPRKRRSYPAELKAKVALRRFPRWRSWRPATMASEPQLEEAQKVLAGFSGNPSAKRPLGKPRSRSCRRSESSHRAGFFIQEQRWSIPPTPGSASYGCRVVSIARSSCQGENPLNLRLMRLIDKFLETPFYGASNDALASPSDTQTGAPPELLGVHALSSGRTSQSHPAHRIYPYCCANHARTTARMLPTFPCSGAFCIWSR